jgi:hypothetical protein
MRSPRGDVTGSIRPLDALLLAIAVLVATGGLYVFVASLGGCEVACGSEGEQRAISVLFGLTAASGVGAGYFAVRSTRWASSILLIVAAMCFMIGLGQAFSHLR